MVAATQQFRGDRVGKSKSSSNGGKPADGKPAPKLPEGVTVEDSDGFRDYTFSVNGSEVSLTVEQFSGREGYMLFAVNDSFNINDNSLSQRDRDRTALRLARIARYDASTRPEGFRYRLSASTEDGFGARRVAAYESAGFSRPVGGVEGSSQFGVVRNGRIVPDTRRLAREEDLSGFSSSDVSANVSRTQANRQLNRTGRTVN